MDRTKWVLPISTEENLHSFDFSGLYSTYDWQQQIDCNSNKGIKFQACLKLRSDFDNGELTFFLPLPLDFFPFFSCSLSCPSSLKLYRAQISAISVHHHHRNPIKAFFFFFFSLFFHLLSHHPSFTATIFIHLSNQTPPSFTPFHDSPVSLTFFNPMIVPHLLDFWFSIVIVFLLLLEVLLIWYCYLGCCHVMIFFFFIWGSPRSLVCGEGNFKFCFFYWFLIVFVAHFL